jgi:hypothetical protein
MGRMTVKVVPAPPANSQANAAAIGALLKAMMPST